MTDADGNPLPPTVETTDADGNVIEVDANGDVVTPAVPEPAADPTVTPATPTPTDGPTPEPATSTEPTSPEPTSSEPSADSATDTGPTETPSSDVADAPAPEPEAEPASTVAPEEASTVPMNEQEQLIASATPPDTNPGVLIPTDGSFGDTRELAAAEAAGIPTPAGAPLTAAAVATLRELETAFGAIEQWVAYARKKIAGIPRA